MAIFAKWGFWSDYKKRRKKRGTSTVYDRATPFQLVFESDFIVNEIRTCTIVRRHDSILHMYVACSF